MTIISARSSQTPTLTRVNLLVNVFTRTYFSNQSILYNLKFFKRGEMVLHANRCTSERNEEVIDFAKM